MLITVFIAATSLLGSPDPEGVVATAPAVDVAASLEAAVPPTPDSPAAAVQAGTPHGLSTDQQISRWISERRPDDRPFAEDGLGLPGVVDDRQVHSAFSVGVGTGGYRDYSASVSLPIGENARLDLHIRQTENAYPGYRYGPYGFDGYGYDPYFADGGLVTPGRGVAADRRPSFSASFSADEAGGERERLPSWAPRAAD